MTNTQYIATIQSKVAIDEKIPNGGLEDALYQVYTSYDDIVTFRSLKQRAAQAKAAGDKTKHDQLMGSATALAQRIVWALSI
jgi:hypothetical protein